MSKTRIVLTLDDDDIQILDRAKELARIKVGAKNPVATVRVALREYVAANEPKQEPK